MLPTFYSRRRGPGDANQFGRWREPAIWPRLAGRYNFALLQRNHSTGFELQPGGDAASEDFHLSGTAFPANQSWS